MRDYATVSPVFWTGQTGRRLKAAGPDAMLVALYLVTSPHSNALGLYYLPALYVAHETGLPLEGASKALQRAQDAGFCAYDQDAEVVWVFEMARFQIGSALSPKDNRVKWVNEEYAKLPKCKFLKDFFDKYASAFHLKEARGGAHNTTPLEAPSEPHRSQEQEQDQDKEEPSLRSGSCPEVAEPPAGQMLAELPKLVGTLPLADGSDFEVRQDLVDELTPLYPAVDVLQALRSMKGWLLADPKRRKTSRGVRRFISAWLDRDQNKGGNVPAARASPAPGPIVPRSVRDLESIERHTEAERLLRRGRPHENAGIANNPGRTGQTQCAALSATAVDTGRT